MEFNLSSARLCLQGCSHTVVVSSSSKYNGYAAEKRAGDFDDSSAFCHQQLFGAVHRAKEHGCRSNRNGHADLTGPYLRVGARITSGDTC